MGSIDNIASTGYVDSSCNDTWELINTIDTMEDEMVSRWVIDKDSNNLPFSLKKFWWVIGEFECDQNPYDPQKVIYSYFVTYDKNNAYRQLQTVSFQIPMDNNNTSLNKNTYTYYYGERNNTFWNSYQYRGYVNNPHSFGGVSY